MTDCGKLLQQPKISLYPLYLLAGGLKIVSHMCANKCMDDIIIFQCLFSATMASALLRLSLRPKPILSSTTTAPMDIMGEEDSKNN